MENASVLVSDGLWVSRRERQFVAGWSSLSLRWPLLPLLGQAVSHCGAWSLVTGLRESKKWTFLCMLFVPSWVTKRRRDSSRAPRSLMFLLPSHYEGRGENRGSHRPGILFGGCVMCHAGFGFTPRAGEAKRPFFIKGSASGRSFPLCWQSLGEQSLNILFCTVIDKNKTVLKPFDFSTYNPWPPPPPH